MNYFINSSALTAVFAVPCSVVDRHIKLAGAVQLKVLLWSMRNMGDGVTAEKLSDALGLPVVDVTDALQYWIESDILMPDKPEKETTTEQNTEKKEPRHIVRATIKPNREDVAKRGLECPEIAFLLQEAQMKFGRGLRQNESSTLVWLYDDEGVSVALIFMLIEFAVSEERCNIGFIERTAIDWLNNGINTIELAEKKICEIHNQRSAWNTVRKAMGIDNRKPSPNELKLAYTWVEEWKFSREILNAAYNQCIDSISKFSMPYIKKILEKWHNDNVKSMSDVKNSNNKNASKRSSKSNYAAYDLDLVEEMLLNDNNEE